MHLLHDGFNQSYNVALKLENMGYPQLCDALDYMIRNKHKIGNLKLINKLGKCKDISSRNIRNGKYKKQIRGFL